jgi:glycosyltransferase involved in cell wall biosynthesis
LERDRIMNAWLVTVGEQLPIDPGDSRLMRTGTLARFLCQRGHQVVWWTSTFNHVHKHHRFDCDKRVQVDSNLTIRLLHGIGYKRHVSISRLLDHGMVARKFSTFARSEARPDVIVASLPTLELAAAACAFGAQVGAPVVLDIRDLWPDAFAELLPTLLRSVAAPAFFAFRRLAKYSCSSARAIIGPARRYVDWGIALAGRSRTPWDREFPFAYTSSTPSPEAIQAAEEFWKDHGISKIKGDFLICFFGLLGRQFDLQTVIESARILQQSHARIRFVICGTGDHHQFYRDLARGCRNVIFPGWVGAAEIWTLMRMATLGMAPYCSNSLFNDHLPNKPIEYLSASLPVLASVRGALGSLLEAHECGAIYDNGAPAELARTIAQLHDDPVRLNRMSHNAGQLYHRSFEAEQVYPELVRFLERVSESACASPRTSALA